MVEYPLWMGLLLVAGGILMLALGASWLVEGASRLALRLGVSPMIVGLTVVGFGTSMPEFSVSVLAAMRGSGGLGLGNAVGSNIMNLVMVLGVSALIYPISVAGGRRVVQRDLVFGLLPALLLLGLAWHGTISRATALLLLAVFVVFMATCVRQSRSETGSRAVVAGSTIGHLALTAVGIAILVTGAELMVRGGVSMALRFGVSEAVIGLSLVAFGTSLPELATSVVAALKRQAEISVGNVLGSNVFNLGLIVGTAFTIRPAEVPEFVIRHDIPMLVAATAVVGLVVLRDGRIQRREGAVLLLMFLAYVTFLVIRGG
jgi:cation:H+ antiporter